MRIHVQVLVLCLKDTMPMCSDFSSDFSELVLVWQQMHVPAMLSCDCLDASLFFFFINKKIHRLA